MRHVLVVGVDGVRTDALAAASTPNIDAIAADGFYSVFDVSDDTPTLSGPCWATVATGMWPRTHGIYGNTFTGHRLAVYGDFLTQVRHRGLTTYAALTWAPLATTAHGGPMFVNPSRLSYVDSKAYGHDAADQAVVDEARRALHDGDFAASFVYLGAADETAHRVDTGARYLASIETADRRIGSLLDAIKTRPAYAEEQWTYIVVTDHGHRDGGGHSSRTEWERQAWIAASGPDIPQGEVTACHADVAPSVMRALGFDAATEFCFAGQPFSARCG